MNYFSYVLDYVKDHTGHPYAKSASTYIKHLDTINRCFYPNSVEEIIELLKKEETPFAKMCLDKMN